MRHIVLKGIFHLLEKTSTKIDDMMIESGFLNRLSYAIPIIIIYNLFETIVGPYQIINIIFSPRCYFIN